MEENKPESEESLLPDEFTVAIQKLYKAAKIDVTKGKYLSVPELISKHGKVLSSSELEVVKGMFPDLFK